MSGRQPHLRLWRPTDFDDTCEECEAPPRSLCRPGCQAGYTHEMHQRAVEREKELNEQ
ncbi:hypothetical protein AB0J38_14540 [Streptomyces sp. NPDC050095]|uniref:hypothetical protein n=1 Tax=unclassified Streptomyces TaxID=2593676 RepID=UPI0034427141